MSLVFPVIGLVLFVLLTGMYGLNRAARYSTFPKAAPPGVRKVGDDYLKVLELSRDRRSVSLVIGQALYDHRSQIERVFVPPDLEGMSSIPGPVVNGSRKTTIRPPRFELLSGVKPETRAYEPRLSLSRSLELLARSDVREYPMGVTVVGGSSGDSGDRSDWAIVGTESGTRLIVAPVRLLPEAR